MTVVKHNGQFYIFPLQDCKEDRLRPLRSKKEVKVKRSEVARRSMREMKCSKEHVTMVKILVECLKSNQGEITTLSREGVTNSSFEG